MGKVSKILSFAAFLILALLSAVVFVSYTNIQNRTSNYETAKAEIQNQLIEFVESNLEQTDKRATLQANYVKENITSEILLAYAGKEKQLQEDMDNVQVKGNTPLLTIISNNIKGRYINSESDANDMFVIGKWVKAPNGFALDGAIIGDKSLDCSKNGELRTFDVEVSLHSNQALAYDALARILNQDASRPLFWEFLQSKDSEHTMLTTADMRGIEQIIRTEGLDGLKTYEVLNPVYINSKSDILGVEDVDNTGNKNGNRKIIIIQGYSMYEAITSGNEAYIQSYTDDLKQCQADFDNDVRLLQVETILLCIIVLVVFASIVKLQNMALEN